MDTQVVEPETQNSKIHLLVLCHGLWGQPVHLHMLERLLMERWKREHQAGGIKLVILAAAGNSETNTYDGIDLCAERVTQEIDELTREQEKAGNKIVKFSIVGYSLGGLIARFVLGLLHSRKPSYFDQVEPASFSTFATPHIGIPKYPTFWSPTLIFLGSKFLSRSGGQLYARDDFHQGKPLIEVMTQEGTSFMSALRKFPKISIYASALNDRTVPFPTGAIQRHDPFARAERKMLKGRSKLLLSEEYPVDLREGGMKIKTSSKYPPLIESYESCTPVLPSSDKPAPKKPWYHFKWPLLLKPSGYPFFPPVVRYIVVFTFPIIVPFFIVLLMGRFILQNVSSRRRIRAVSVGELKTKEGRLRRVNLMLDKVNDMIEDQMSMANAASLPNESESTLTTGANSPSTDEGAPLTQSKSMIEETRVTDPVLTEAQSNALTNLGNIKQLERYLAYFPNARNAHGTIICRTESFPGFKDGIPIVQHWADHFPL